jgi:hypothetical protein
MRPGNNARRPRGRPNRKQHGSPRAHTFDSHGPDVRIRGNAPQIYDKYVTLARDATASGDRIAAEGYYQFAEHYFRIMNDSTDPRRPVPQPSRPEEERPASNPTPRLGDQEQPQVEWPVELDAANGGGVAEGAAQAAETTAATPPAAEEEKQRRPSKGRPRGRRRTANGAKDPADKPAAKLDGDAAGAGDGADEETGPGDKTDKDEIVNP